MVAGRLVLGPEDFQAKFGPLKFFLANFLSISYDCRISCEVLLTVFLLQSQ